MSATKILSNILKILRNVITKKRAELGLAQVHDELLSAPFCEKQQCITKINVCRKCSDDDCVYNNSCSVCLGKGIYHELPYWSEEYNKKFISFK